MATASSCQAALGKSMLQTLQCFPKARESGLRSHIWPYLRMYLELAHCMLAGGGGTSSRLRSRMRVVQLQGVVTASIVSSHLATGDCKESSSA